MKGKVYLLYEGGLFLHPMTLVLMGIYTTGKELEKGVRTWCMETGNEPGGAIRNLIRDMQTAYPGNNLLVKVVNLNEYGEI